MGKIIIGAVVAAIGWLFLILDPSEGAIINLHKLAITNNIILLGYAVALWGVIDESSQKPYFIYLIMLMI